MALSKLEGKWGLLGVSGLAWGLGGFDQVRREVGDLRGFWAGVALTKLEGKWGILGVSGLAWGLGGFD